MVKLRQMAVAAFDSRRATVVLPNHPFCPFQPVLLLTFAQAFPERVILKDLQRMPPRTLVAFPLAWVFGFIAVVMPVDDGQQFTGQPLISRLVYPKTQQQLLNPQPPKADMGSQAGYLVTELLHGIVFVRNTLFFSN